MDYVLPCLCAYTFCLNLWFKTFFSNIFCNDKSAKSWKFAENLKETASSQGFKPGTTLSLECLLLVGHSGLASGITKQEIAIIVNF